MWLDTEEDIDEDADVNADDEAEELQADGEPEEPPPVPQAMPALTVLQGAWGAGQHAQRDRLVEASRAEACPACGGFQRKTVGNNNRFIQVKCTCGRLLRRERVLSHAEVRVLLVPADAMFAYSCVWLLQMHLCEHTNCWSQQSLATASQFLLHVCDVSCVRAILQKKHAYVSTWDQF